MNKKIQVKLNADMLKHKAGAIVDFEVDDNGLPTGQGKEAVYWRRRFKEAKQNNCLEIIVVKTEKKKKDKNDC